MAPKAQTAGRGFVASSPPSLDKRAWEVDRLQLCCGFLAASRIQLSCLGHRASSPAIVADTLRGIAAPRQARALTYDQARELLLAARERRRRGQARVRRRRPPGGRSSNGAIDRGVLSTRGNSETLLHAVHRAPGPSAREAPTRPPPAPRRERPPRRVGRGSARVVGQPARLGPVVLRPDGEPPPPGAAWSRAASSASAASSCARLNRQLDARHHGRRAPSPPACAPPARGLRVRRGAGPLGVVEVEH